MDKDQNVFSFMMQLVQEKMGDEVDMVILESESDRLYNMFGDYLVSYFEPQLSDEQKKQFDQLVEGNEDQELVINFLQENIQDLEQQIIQLLVKFRSDYIAGLFNPPETAEESTGNDENL